MENEKFHDLKNIFGLDSAPHNESKINIPKNVFHKNCWIDANDEQIEILKNCLKEKLERGHGEMILSIGASDTDNDNGLTRDELELSLKTLTEIEKSLNFSVCFLRDRKIVNNLAQDPNSEVKSSSQNEPSVDRTNSNSQKFIRDILIRKKYDHLQDFIEVRVAVVGNVDSGKSTLLGVLTHCVLDDGRGEARTKLFRHKHEIESGRTSSVGNDILGFDSNGKIVNDSGHLGGKVLLDWESICTKSSKVMTFIDLAGHERYLKTTIFGMTGHAPDFCMLMENKKIGSNMGVIGMTKEHLGLALALNVPVFVVITKIDMCPPNILQETLKVLQKVLKSPGCRKIPYIVENSDDMITCAMNFTSERLCPIFQVSNVTGNGLDLLRNFLNLLNTRMEHLIDEPAEFQIDDLYSVPGVGTVVSGTCYKGRIQINDNLLLGPDLIGQFKPVAIKGIHRKRLPVKECRSGQTASFALKKIKRSELRKGMVLVSERCNPVASWEFEAEMLILHHPTTISVNYQAMVHTGSIRQTATITQMSVSNMRTGDKANVRFAFIKNPEYLKLGSKMIFREGRTKAVGTITKVNIQKPVT